MKIHAVKSKASLIKSKFIYELRQREHEKKLPVINSLDRAIVNAIRENGVFVTSLENLLIESTTKLVHATYSLFNDIPTAVPDNLVGNEYINRNAIEANSTQIITQYPEIFLWGVEERLLNLAENYIGLPVAYHGVNCRRDIINNKLIGTRLWHTDGDDIRMLKIIVYMSDVTEDGGPFEYIPKSQLFWHAYLKFRFMRKGASAFGDEEIKKILPKSVWKSCLGAKGTVIFVDPRRVFHHGKMPALERLALFFLYTTRHPLRPEISKHSFNFKQDHLLDLAKQLSYRQKECIFYN